MLERMAAFDNEAITLGELVADLEGLLYSLENLDESWQNSFLKQWGILEDVYADALDQKLKELPSEHKALIENAIDELRKLASQKI